MPYRDSGLPHDTRNITSTSGNVFERLPAREGQTFTLFNNSKNLASSSQELRPDIPRNTKRPESEMRREPQKSPIPVPRFQSGGGMLNHTGGTYSNGGMIEYPRCPIPELHGKSTARLKYVQNQRFLTSLCNGSKKLRKQNQLTIL